MSGYVDFKELKSSVTIEQVVKMLGLNLRKQGNQLRGRCPIHKGTSEREFVITPGKGLFFCFGPCGGGDMITLAAKVRGLSNREAARFIAEHFGGVGAPRNRTVSGNGSPQPGSTTAGQDQKADRILQPLAYLEPVHELVQGLGVSPEAASDFGAGYAPKGIMRGRLAIPIRDRNGRLLAYCGRALRDESPALIFPNGFDPGGVIFNADRITGGELCLVRDPLRVLAAHENGIVNVVAFLTHGITPRQLGMLAALMDERKCETLELF